MNEFIVQANHLLVGDYTENIISILRNIKEFVNLVVMIDINRTTILSDECVSRKARDGDVFDLKSEKARKADHRIFLIRLLVEKNDYENDFSKELKKKIEFICSFSKLIVFNIEKRFDDGHRKVLGLLTETKNLFRVSGGPSVSFLTIAIHEVQFCHKKNRIRETKENIENSELHKQLSDIFEINIECVVPAIEYSTKTVCKSYLSAIRSIFIKNINNALLTNIINASGTTGNYLSWYIHSYVNERHAKQFEEIKFSTLKKHSFLSMLRNVSSECLSQYKRVMDSFSDGRAILTEFLLNEHDKVLAQVVIPLFSGYVKGVPSDCIEDVEQVFFVMIQKIVRFSDGKIVFGILRDIIKANKKRSHNIGLKLQKLYNEQFKNIDKTTDPYLLLKETRLKLKNTKEHTGPVYKKVFNRIIDQLIIILSDKFVNEKTSIQNLGSKLFFSSKHSTIPMHSNNNTYLCFREICSILCTEHKNLVLLEKRRSTSEYKFLFEDISIEMTKILSLQNSYEKYFVLFQTPSIKIEPNINKGDNTTHRQTLSLKSLYRDVYEILSQKDLLPDNLRNCKLSCSEEKEERISTSPINHNKFTVFQIHENMKRPLILISFTDKGIIHNRDDPQKKYPILVKRENIDDVFKILICVKYKTKGNVELRCLLKLFDKETLKYEHKCNGESLYDKLQASYQIKSSKKNIMEIASLQIGSQTYAIPVIITKTEESMN